MDRDHSRRIRRPYARPSTSTLRQCARRFLGVPSSGSRMRLQSADDWDQVIDRAANGPADERHRRLVSMARNLRNIGCNPEGVAWSRHTLAHVHPGAEIIETNTFSAMCEAAEPCQRLRNWTQQPPEITGEPRICIPRPVEAIAMHLALCPPGSSATYGLNRPRTRS